ncbi:uncharacterized protein LOC134716449 [Mytilus trossulus]|uniref:uncharacterized protein LOC134716449 n=1 Tax=Mytilus trossulus TaxID=6551 RepID=UPI00300774B3
MEKQTDKGDVNDSGDCSDDDLLKGSDDAVNVVKSPKYSSDKHSVMPNKIKCICIGTMVSAIGIVLTIALSVIMLAIVTTDDQKQNAIKLLTAILKISNQLDSLSIKTNSDSSTKDGPKACENINTNYLYYVLQEENRKLKEELQKTKFRKDDQKNSLQLTRISNQLDSLSTKMDSYITVTDGSQTCEKINTSFLYYVLQEENRKLKDKLQITKSKKDSIRCADTDNKRNQQERRKDPLQVSCSSVSCEHSYGWVVANQSLSFGRSDHFDIIIKFKLFYPEIPDNGKILFEFGLMTLGDHSELSHPVIIVSGQRCEKEHGMCLYVKDVVLTKLDDHVFDQKSDYIQGQLTLELHKSYFVLMSNQKNIYISNTVNLSSKVKLWPVFGFYNTHLINISQTILSENKASFNRTTVDTHLFVSEDNSTISSCKLWPKETSFTRWDISIMFIEIAFFIVSTILCIIFMFYNHSCDRFVGDSVFFTSCFLCLPLSLYYLYISWSMYLLVEVSTLLGILLYQLKYTRIESDLMPYAFFTFLDSTYIVILFKILKYIFYLIFF